MPAADHKPDEFDNLSSHEPSHAGEFTRAFGGKPEPPKVENDSSPTCETADETSPAPGSLTQFLRSESTKHSPPPPDELSHPQSVIPNTLDARPASSFTSAFDGVNAFTRNPADLGEPNLPQAAVNPRPDAMPSESSGSFTRLFGSGGVLTPTGDEKQPPRLMTRDPQPSSERITGFLRDRVQTSAPPSTEPASFTQVFHAQPSPEPRESNPRPRSFTEEIGAPPSWPTPEPPMTDTYDGAYPARPRDKSVAYDVEPLASPQRPPEPAGGFTRLIDTLRPDPLPPRNPALPSVQSARPLADPNYAGRASGPGDGATVVFNPRPPEPEVTAPRGKSEYTMVVERSKLRTPSEVPGTGGSPYGAGASAAPPNPLQYPQVAPPVPPAWMPPPMPPPMPQPTIPWQQPQATLPPMPQAPVIGAPGLAPQPRPLGDKLVSFLPFMLALTVINFLGFLAVLIILFATRR